MSAVLIAIRQANVSHSFVVVIVVGCQKTWISHLKCQKFQQQQINEIIRINVLKSWLHFQSIRFHSLIIFYSLIIIWEMSMSELGYKSMYVLFFIKRFKSKELLFRQLFTVCLQCFRLVFFSFLGSLKSWTLFSNFPLFAFNFRFIFHVHFIACRTFPLKCIFACLSGAFLSFISFLKMKYRRKKCYQTKKRE